MPSATNSDTNVNNDHSRDHTFNFLRLPAELRNEIYRYAFAAEPESTLTPHPLTQANTQVRHECLSLYYASIAYLRVPIFTPQQVARTRKWLAEVDRSRFPVLPTIEFSPWWLSKSAVRTIWFTREERLPAEEMPFYMTDEARPIHLFMWRTIHQSALYHLYLDCLGCKKPESYYLTSTLDASEDFVRIVKDSSPSITRRWNDGGSPPYVEDEHESSTTCIVRKMDHEFGKEIVRVADRNQGRDWDMDDLKRIVEWFELDFKDLYERLAWVGVWWES